MGTHAFNKKCAVQHLVSKARIKYEFYSRKNSGRSYMRARKKRSGLHLQYAGEAPDIRETEQDAEDYRHCEAIISMSIHSLPPALITNTSCELIVPIQCTLHTRTMGQLTAHHVSQNSSCFPNPQEQGIAKCTIHAM